MSCGKGTTEITRRAETHGAGQRLSAPVTMIANLRQDDARVKFGTTGGLTVADGLQDTARCSYFPDCNM